MAKFRFYLTLERRITQGGTMSLDIDVPIDVVERDDEEELFNFASDKITALEMAGEFPFGQVEWGELDDIDSTDDGDVTGIEVGEEV